VPGPCGIAAEQATATGGTYAVLAVILAESGSAGRA